jgi:hypothetical protein
LEKKTTTVSGKWPEFMKKGGMAAAALGILMLVAHINPIISIFFIFGGAASWLGSKALKA